MDEAKMNEMMKWMGKNLSLYNFVSDYASGSLDDHLLAMVTLASEVKSYWT